jgi:hypothetical protein
MYVKYEVLRTGETKPALYTGRPLYRVRALVDLRDDDNVLFVKTGDVGGWVESEKNLSQFGRCWIFNEAACWYHGYVTNNARLCDYAVCWAGAVISGNARVSQRASVNGTTHVIDDARVSGNARVTAGSLVFERATISGTAHLRMNYRVGGDTFITSGTYPR